MQKFLLEKNRENGYHIYNVPGIFVTKKGTVLVYYECRHGGDWSVSDLALRRSTDGKFFDKKIIVSGQGHNTVHSLMLLEREGILYALWLENYHRLYLMKSTDDGVTFSDKEDITYALEGVRSRYLWQVAAIGPGHGILTKSGRMLFGVWLAGNLADRNKHFPSVMTTLYSDDGVIWKTGEILPSTEAFPNPSESVLEERECGGIYMNFRHEGTSRRRGVTYSPTGTDEWTEYFSDKSLPDPICAAGLTKAKGMFLFTNCSTEGSTRDGRKNLCLKIGKDGFGWERTLPIDEEGGYSDVAYSPQEDCAYVVYNGGRMNDAEDWWQYEGIRLARISADEWKLRLY